MADILIKVCGGNACSKSFSRYIIERAQNEVENISSSQIEIQEVGCQGNCENGPTVVVEQGGKKQVYSRMNPIEIGNLIRKLKTNKK